MLTNSKIDKIGAQLRDGVADAECLRNLEEFRKLYIPAYRHVESILKETMRLTITGRPSKSTVAIVEKLRRETTRLNQIQDIAGCRVICTDIDSQDYFVSTMKILLQNPQIDDKREQPTNAYRAVHVVAKFQGRPVEIQVRTALQHAWAEISEKLADKHGHSIKYGKGDERILQFLENLSNGVRELDLIRKKRREVSRRKTRFGKSLALVREAKMLSADENESMRKLRRLFDELEAAP